MEKGTKRLEVCRLPCYSAPLQIPFGVFPCQGSVPVAGIHFTHQMGSGRVSFCEFCRGRHCFGPRVSRKLSLPRGTSARAMYRLAG